MINNVISKKWKSEFAKTAAAYESLIAKIKTENEAVVRESNNWRG